IVQARSDGFVEKVYPLTIGDHVKKGTPLIDITIPEWVEAQSEFLLLSGRIHLLEFAVSMNTAAYARGFQEAC
ncbi:efflux RND transporter periplasmic adaptor subunit, partial [Enterobacter kobei]|uniref:efflux RND transporter periplasmic adaptor subunit n=1 Tax=Enterobacter kobei TaxID=208224 RepID=UPI0029D891B3